MENRSTKRERLRDAISIKDIFRHPRGVELVAEAKGQTKQELSGEALIGLMDKYIVGAKLSAQIGHSVGKRLGFNAESAESANLPDTPYAYAVLGLLCAVAKANMDIIEIGEENPGLCAIHVTTPSSIWASAGEAFFTATIREDDCEIKGRALTRGQLIDWGRNRRLLNGVLKDVGMRARTYSTLDL
jgi:hypothetical protein